MRPRRPGMPFVLRFVAALAAGGVLYASFPPRSLWWLAPVAFAILWLVVHGRRARAGFGYGVLFGLAFMIPLISWTGLYVGPAPWLVLSATEAVLIGLAGMGAAAVVRLPAAPLWAAALWIAAEAARARVPFGGFPWGKIAFGQADGSFLPLAALGGTPLLSFAVVLCGFGLGELIRRMAAQPRRPARLVMPALLLLLPIAGALAAAPLVNGPSAADRTITVAAIQGNVPRLGLDFNSQRRAVLDNHVARTEQLAADVAPAGCHGPTSCSGRRTPPTSTRCRNADARRRSTSRPSGDRRADPGRRRAAEPGRRDDQQLGDRLGPR